LPKLRAVGIVSLDSCDDEWRDIGEVDVVEGLDASLYLGRDVGLPVENVEIIRLDVGFGDARERVDVVVDPRRDLFWIPFEGNMAG